MKHTPGPWKAGKENGGQIEVRGADGFPVVSFCTDIYDVNRPDTPGIDRANAKLVTEAPAMLQALKDVYKVVFEYVGQQMIILAREKGSASELDFAVLNGVAERLLKAIHKADPEFVKKEIWKAAP